MERRFMGSARVPIVVASVVVVTAAVLVVASIRPAGSSSPSVAWAASPSTASSGATGLVLVGGPAAGYEMHVPTSWKQATPIHAEAQRWVGGDATVMVSYGASIFDGGGITQCGPRSPELPTCMKETYTYSIPYDPERDGVGPLVIDGYLRDRCTGGCKVKVAETTLGGERAQRASTITAGVRATYVATFHDRRPVIVYWSEPEEAVDDIRLDGMLASFHFIDAQIPSPTPFLDPTELVRYEDAKLGYEIMVPRFWGEGSDHVNWERVHEFGSGIGFGTRTYPALSISVGTPDGSVAVCQGTDHRCNTIDATNLAVLEASLVGKPEGFPGREAAGDAVLAGHDARFKRPRYRNELASHGEFGIGGNVAGNCLGCPGMLYHLYTVVDGRPVVISIDWWTLAFGALPSEYTGRILSSFRILDR